MDNIIFKPAASSGKTQYESVLEDFLAEKGLKEEFSTWLEENYPSDLSKCEE